MKSKKWLALFSQSGKEIMDIVKELKVKPDHIISSNNLLDTWDIKMNKFGKSEISKTIISGFNKMTREEKVKFYRESFTGYDIITLHGWLYIIPPEICTEFVIYNGHPGLITVYPELRGRDPQDRAWNNIGKYPEVGSVVHRVTPEIDAGDIVSVKSVDSEMCVSKHLTYEILRYTSIQSWLNFLKGNI